MLERGLHESDETDFYDGFGILSDEDADWIRDKREQSKEKRKKRMQRLDENT